MSKRIQSWLVWILSAILLLSCFMLYIDSQKTNENLPSLPEILRLEDKTAKLKLGGYMEHQLQEVWGRPALTGRDSMAWLLPEGSVAVYTDSQGKVVSCKVRRNLDLPILYDLSYMSVEDMEQSLLGRFTDQIASVWDIPDEKRRNIITWNLPPHSPHRGVTVETDDLGIIFKAKFRD